MKTKETKVQETVPVFLTLKIDPSGELLFETNLKTWQEMHYLLNKGIYKMNRLEDLDLHQKRENAEKTVPTEPDTEDS